MSKEWPTKTHNLQQLGSLLRYQRLREAPNGYEGKIYEDIVEKALQLMVKKGEISGFLRAEQYSELDKEGIDFSISVFDQEIPLQVTSTWRGAHCRKRKNPEVPVVWAVTREGRIVEPEEIVVFIRKILKSRTS